MRLIESQKEVIHTLRNPSQHSSTDRKRAYMFVFVYILSFIALSGNMFHFISGWISALVVQVIMTILAVIYAFNINDYSDKSSSAMECERSCNPLVDAYLALRAVQILQTLFLCSYTSLISLTIVFAFNVFRAKSGKLYVDAVNLWREVAKFEKESYILIALDILLILVMMVVMVFSLIYRYS